MSDVGYLLEIRFPIRAGSALNGRPMPKGADAVLFAFPTMEAAEAFRAATSFPDAPILEFDNVAPEKHPSSLPGEGRP